MHIYFCSELGWKLLETNWTDNNSDDFNIWFLIFQCRLRQSATSSTMKIAEICTVHVHVYVDSNHARLFLQISPVNSIVYTRPPERNCYEWRKTEEAFVEFPISTELKVFLHFTSNQFYATKFSFCSNKAANRLFIRTFFFVWILLRVRWTTCLFPFGVRRVRKKALFVICIN